MMKISRLGFMPLFCLMLLLSGCTSNNGDIGPLFGKWKLRSIDYDGVTPPGPYADNIFWNFQNDVVSIQLVEPYSEAWSIYGNWHLADDTLSLDFTDQGESPAPVLMLPDVSRLQVLKITGSEMTLLYRPTEDTGITYYLKKW